MLLGGVIVGSKRKTLVVSAVAIVVVDLRGMFAVQNQ